ncbi:unnamed protein product [Candida verbasci]|uniref:BTB domain-containing protein n=1 Tax=Candida verbasci TaxID=1227364 RepID=A0A9W4TSV9_9ASCO|nr:unnamed protein product [Candida verbasci]
MNNIDIPNLQNLSKDELFKKDIFGRTILHVIILTNNIELFKQLLKNEFIDKILLLCDYESGWNALHYIIFHKRITILKLLFGYFRSINNIIFNTQLIDLLKCKDRNGNVPLQLMNNDFKNLVWIPKYITEDGFEFIYRDKKYSILWDEIARGGSEIYVLGCNTNNQLGLGDSTDRSTPTSISHRVFKEEEEKICDIMRKPRFRKIVISKNHSIVITYEGDVYSSGNGSRGRLGHENLKNCFNFKKIDLTECVDVSISNNHSIVLTENNDIYAWGLNSFNQLGVPNQKSKNYLDDFISTPILLNLKHKEWLLGVQVSKIHSLTWSKNNLYFWGLNVGQMGIICHGDIEVKLQDESIKGEIQFPKMVSLRDEIKCVSTSELITCVVTVQNDIHVYYKHQHFKLPKIYKGNDKHFDIFKPARITEAAVINKIVTRGPDNNMILLSNGSILKFSINVNDSKNTKYTSVWKAYDHELVAIDLDLSNDGSVVLCTKSGHVFVKSVQSNQRKSSMSGTTLPIALSKNKFKKIENINNIVRVTCDAKFLSLGFIRDDINLLPFELRKNRFFKDIEYLSSVNEVNYFRKQDQLFKKKTQCYITNYFDMEIDEFSEDKLLEQYNQHFKADPVKLEDTYECYSQDEIEMINNLFDEEYNYTEIEYGKEYDSFIEVAGVKIGFHKELFRIRSPIFKRLYDLDDPNEYLISQVKANWSKGILKIENVQILSVLLLIHTVCSNRKVDIWKRYNSRHNFPNRLKLVHDEYDQLLNSFEISYNQTTKFISEFQNFNNGNVLFKLLDGELNAHSFILKSRSAYFETLLSDRWDNIKELDFTGLTTFQMSFILKHLYGVSNVDIFETFKFQFHQRDEFINSLLELIEIADEMLLFQLKDLIQLVIGDMISLENVLILIVHADYLSCKKLFYQCCWYIYNNLELLIFDSSFKEIPNEILEKLETQIKFLQDCHKIDIHSSKKWNWTGKLVNQFVNNITEFNENFMSDRKGFSSFELIIDNERKPKDVSKKKKSRKSSTLNNDIIEFRKSINSNVDAIKKSPSPVSQLPSPPNSSTSNKVKSISPPPKSILNWANGTNSDKPELQTQAKEIKFNGWATDPNSAQKSMMEFSPTPSPELKSKPKLKFTKLSQKERKKLAAQQVEVPKASPPPQQPSNLAPWSNISCQPISNNSVNDLPILGSTKSSNGKISPPPAQRSTSMSDTISITSTPSLQEIMIQETLKLEQSKNQDTKKKSLLEIQQEQEFAKWWDQESKRVQKEMKKQQPRKRKEQK